MLLFQVENPLPHTALCCKKWPRALSVKASYQIVTSAIILFCQLPLADHYPSPQSTVACGMLLLGIMMHDMCV